MRKAMDEVRQRTASRRMNDAINTQNGPSTTFVYDFPINLLELIYQEGNAGQLGE